jgi:hypothetical protein
MAPDFSPQRLDFAAQTCSFERVLNGDAQLLKVEGLADEVVSSQFQSVFHVFQLRIGRNRDDRRRILRLPDLLENLDPAHIGHANIEQHQVGRLVLGKAQAGIARGSLDDLVSPLFALLTQRPAHQALVVDNQDLLCRHADLDYYGKEARTPGWAEKRRWMRRVELPQLSGSSAPNVVVADDLEYGYKMGHTQKLPNRLPNVEELQRAACRFCGNVQADQRAQARAVHVSQIREVQHDSFRARNQPADFQVEAVAHARHQAAGASHCDAVTGSVHCNC